VPLLRLGDKPQGQPATATATPPQRGPVVGGVAE
jgi:hypothetical protein